MAYRAAKRIGNNTFSKLADADETGLPVDGTDATAKDAAASVVSVSCCWLRNELVQGSVERRGALHFSLAACHAHVLLTLPFFSRIHYTTWREVLHNLHSWD